MDFQVCQPQKTGYCATLRRRVIQHGFPGLSTSKKNRVLCHFKMLPITELMNIPDATFVKSTQSSATTEQT